MVNALQHEGLYDSTLIVITAKHGQSPIDPARYVPQAQCRLDAGYACCEQLPAVVRVASQPDRHRPDRGRHLAAVADQTFRAATPRAPSQTLQANAATARDR